MRTRLHMLAPLAALLLGGCGAAEMGATAAGLFLGGQAAKPAQPAAVAIDQKLLKTAAKRATEATESFTAAAVAGRIPASGDSDTARPNFCKLVIEGLAILDESNAGSKGSALTCWIEHHADRAGAAIDAGDGTAYAEHLGKLETYTDQLVALVRAANRGAAQ